MLVATVITETVGSPPRARGDQGNCAHRLAWRWVHPRVRGEIRKCLDQLRHIKRFTPACAGRSPSRKRRPWTAFGSPPRARGDPWIGSSGVQGPRFTPACAGRSDSPAVAGHLPTGSPPRARGDLRPCYSLISVSPVHPRVRGEIYRDELVEALYDRFTPACAGRSAIRRVGMHQIGGSPPRARGDRLERTLMVLGLAGSPPRARGDRQCPWT